MTSIILYVNGDKITLCPISFDLFNSKKWHVTLLGAKGRKTKKYLMRAKHLNSKSSGVMFHRELLNLQVGDGKIVDHINGDGLDNRLCNLRLCTKQQNAMSRKKKSTASLSKYIGVSFDSRKQHINKRWHASIKSGDTVRAKYFLTEIEAAKTRDEWAKELHGEFAALNFT